MYQLTCISVAHFQLIAGWLLSWDVVFITRIGCAGGISVHFSAISSEHAATLSRSGASFTLIDVDSNEVIASGPAGTLITPAHVKS